MGLTVSTVAPTLKLTTKAAVKLEMGITATTDDALLDTLIDQASSAIVAYCRRPFARETYSETLGGFGGIRLQVARTPVVAITALTIQGNVITDFGVEDADRGWIYMRSWSGTASQTWQRQPFPWTAQSYGGLSGGGQFLDWGTPLPGQEEPAITADYTAGYILPSQFIAPLTVSVSQVDNSFNDSASGFPSLLKSGDIIETSGFAQASNNGRFKVSGTPTTAKVVVTSTLVTEAAPGTATSIKFRPPSSHRPFDDVEKACIEAAKSFYSSRRDDSNIVEKHAGPMGLRFGEGEKSPSGLPAACVGLLRPWVRAA